MSDGVVRHDMKGSVYGNHVDRSNKPIPDTLMPSQVQNVQAARVYVFGDADLAEEELLNEEDVFELRARGRQCNQSRPAKEEPVYIERSIKDGETLEKIAVKYCCNISDLKRLNNLISEQDFYALKFIKVPVQRHSLVQEKLEEELRNGLDDNRVDNLVKPTGASNIPDGLLEANISDEDDWRDIYEEDSEQPLVRTVSIRDTSQGQDAKNFLERMDKDIKSILTSTTNSKRNLEEVRSTLTCRRIYPLRRRNSFLGADCGIKFSTIITVIVIVAIVTPLMYFVYFEYIKPPDAHPTTHPNDGS